MEPAHYTDPLEEALSHGSQRVAQLASLAAAMAQVVMQRRALEEARKAIVGDERSGRMLDEQERLLRGRRGSAGHRPTTRSGSPRQDSRRPPARGQAPPPTPTPIPPPRRRCASAKTNCAGSTPTRWPTTTGSAATARPRSMRCGRPLRCLPALRMCGLGIHPIRGSALSQEAWPGAGLPAGETPADVPEPGPAVPPDDRGEQRGREIVEQLQQRARAAGRPPLEADELAMALEAATNLPVDVIDRVTRDAPPMARSDSEERRAAVAERPRAAGPGHAVDPPASPLVDERTTGLVDAHRDAGAHGAAQAQAARGQSAAQIAARSFPYSASEAVRATATARVKAPGPAAVPVQAPAIPKRPASPL